MTAWRTPGRMLVALVTVLLAAATLLAGAPAALATPGPSSAPEYWFDRWHVHSLWAAGARGQGVTIAEIDTGVNAALPELRGRILEGKDFGVRGDGRIDREVDLFGHGTAMASIMVARPGLLGIAGLAPRAEILPIAVPLNGTTDQRQIDRLPEAIDWATEHGADIINMSVGGKQYAGTVDTPCPAAEQDAVFRALRKGIVVVAAVGNTGPYVNTVEDPGACLGVLSVGAVDDTGTVASFSSRQPYLSLVAPGVNIPSLGRKQGDAFAGDGTSQAAALVSAALALGLSAHPGLDGRLLVTRLLATLEHRRTTSSSTYGYGEVDAEALVRAAVPADAPNPVYAAAAPFARRAAAISGTDAANGAVGTHVPIAGASAATSDGTAAVPAAGPVTPQVRTGLALMAAGLVAALALLAVGTRRGRPRPRPRPSPGARARQRPAPSGTGGAR